MRAMTFISLTVTQWRTEGARAGTTTRAQAAKRAGASGRSQRSSPSQAGLVKWWSVTSGVSPRSTQPSTMAT